MNPKQPFSRRAIQRSRLSRRSGIPKSSQSRPLHSGRDPDFTSGMAMEVIQTGLTRSHYSSTRHKKGDRIVFCSLDRKPYLHCESCEYLTTCDLVK